MNECSVFHVADVIGKKWTIVILQEVQLTGKKGFNAMLHRLRIITPKILAQRLHELEDEGIIQRRVVSTQPTKTAYKLTNKGKKLNLILRDLRKWNSRYEHCEDRECIKCPLYY